MPRHPQPTRAATPREHPPLAPQPSSPTPPLVALSEPQRAAVMARFEVLKGYRHDSVSLARVAAAAGVPLRTVQRWL
ncbi:MAG TPA: hypothetical protein VGR74_14905, partial [Actinomycetota bacterium]|nr:hypothetical protein [Actinomycetota bacterium]